MRILTYKRTHPGDPNSQGTFGVNDCMGQIRDLSYDAVIGIGGIGSEPRRHNIDGKITWVGIGPSKTQGEWPASLVTFERFLLFDAGGPSLATLAPCLAKRMYVGKVRYLVAGYSPEEHADAQKIVHWVFDATQGVQVTVAKVFRGVKVRCICRPPGSGNSTSNNKAVVRRNQC